MPWALNAIAALRAESNPSPGKKRRTARRANPHRGTFADSHVFWAHHRMRPRINALETLMLGRTVGKDLEATKRAPAEGGAFNAYRGSDYRPRMPLTSLPKPGDRSRRSMPCLPRRGDLAHDTVQRPRLGCFAFAVNDDLERRQRLS